MRAWSRLIWPVAALGLILLFNFFFTPNFFKIETLNGRAYGSVIDVLNRGAPVMLLALGMTLVIGTGGIDLSVGAVMAIAGAVAAVLIVRPDGALLSRFDIGGSVVPAIVIAIAVAIAFGAWNGALVSILDIQPIVATLILMIAGRGVAQLVTDGQKVRITNETFSYLGNGALFGLPITVTIVAVMAILFGLFSRATALGLFVESVGNNPTTSRYCGINARGVKLLCYALSGLCAGIAGLIATANIEEADPDKTGLLLELDAILAVSIGGTALTGGRFSLAGSLIGALVVQSLRTTILMHGVSPNLDSVIKAVVVIAICLLQSELFRAKVMRLSGRRSVA